MGHGSSARPKKHAKAQLQDVLHPEGWNVPVVKTPEDVKMGTGGVFLASPAVVRKELHNFVGAELPVAALCSIDLKIEDHPATKVPVPVQDRDGHAQSRDRFLYQLGRGDVTFDCKAPSRKLVTDSVQVVVTVRQQHVSKEIWDVVSGAPNSSTRKWLTSKASAEVVDTKPATTSDVGGPSIQVVAFVAKDCLLGVLKASGVDGVFVRPFVTKDSGPGDFKVVLLPPGIALEEARSKAKFLGDMAAGIVSTKKGFGIRVEAANFEKAIRAVRPDDAASLIGKMYHISGLPLACGKAALVAFLHEWKFIPVYTFVQGRTRTWAARAEAAPFTEMVQHDDGIVIIKEAPPRPSQPRQTTRWSPPDAKKPPANFPSTWAEVAQKPTFQRGKDLNIREVSAPAQGKAIASGCPAAPAGGAESSIAAAVGKIDELLIALRRLEGRVDGITTDIAELRGDGAGDQMLTDEDPGRRAKTLRIR